MNQGPVLLPGPRLLLSYREKMGQLITTTEDRSVHALLIVTHLSQLPLSILLSSMARHLIDYEIISNCPVQGAI